MSTCANCRFFVVEFDDFGSCHRFPPAVYDETSIGEFPVIRETEWCGEWAKLKEDQSGNAA